eukprot:g77136.t1
MATAVWSHVRQGLLAFLALLGQALAGLVGLLAVLCHSTLRALPPAAQTRALAWLPHWLMTPGKSLSLVAEDFCSSYTGHGQPKGQTGRKRQVRRGNGGAPHRQRQHTHSKLPQVAVSKAGSVDRSGTQEKGRQGAAGEEGAEVPRHVAIIMDGNRRYGRAVYGVGTQGHADGGKTLHKMVEWSIERGVKMMTVYAFSTENWNREPEEINCLMSLFAKNAQSIREKAVERDICVRVLASDPARLPAHIQESFARLEEETKACQGFQLNLCVSYGSRSEIARACRILAEQACAGELSCQQIDESALSQQLLTGGMPDPDLLIRTSGELRLSNFLLWQLAYTEMVFVEKPWPALSRDDFELVLAEYARRKRRFGKFMILLSSCILSDRQLCRGKLEALLSFDGTTYHVTLASLHSLGCISNYFRELDLNVSLAAMTVTVEMFIGIIEDLPGHDHDSM